MSLAAACAVTVLVTTSCAMEKGTASDIPPGRESVTDCRPFTAYADVEAMAADFAQAPSLAGLAGGDMAVDAELAGLPGEYAPPSGSVFVANVDGEPAGCCAFRARPGLRSRLAIPGA